MIRIGCRETVNLFLSLSKNAFPLLNAYLGIVTHPARLLFWGMNVWGDNVRIAGNNKKGKPFSDFPFVSCGR